MNGLFIHITQQLCKTRSGQNQYAISYYAELGRLTRVLRYGPSNLDHDLRFLWRGKVRRYLRSAFANVLGRYHLQLVGAALNRLKT